MKKLFQLSLLSLSLTVPVLAQSNTEPPVPVRTVDPKFPKDLREQGVSGIVMVTCDIDHQGNVQETSVEKSTHQAFEQPALEAVKKWKFRPARKDGEPVAIRVTIPIRFVIQS